MERRGQVTIFIILGIVFIVVIGFVFYVGSSNFRLKLKEIIQKETVVPPQFIPIKNEIDRCVEVVSSYGLYIIGRQGGNINPNLYLTIEDTDISYLYYEGKNRLPTLEAIESQLSSYININLNKCLNDFSEFKAKGFEITTKPVKSKTNFNEDVRITVNYPVTVKKADIRSNFPKEYSVIFPVNFKKYYDVTENIIKKEIENLDSIDIIYLLDQEINIEFTNYDNSIVYALKDEESKLYNETYLFLFANKFKV